MNIDRQRMIRLLIGGALAVLVLCLLWKHSFLRIALTLAVALAAYFLPLGEGTKTTRHFGLAVSSSESKDGRSRSHDCAFAASTLDLTDSGRLPERVRISVAFGSTTVRLPVDASITINASCAFGSVSLPENPGVVLGYTSCRLGSQDPNAPRLSVTARCAFGSLRFIMG